MQRLDQRWLYALKPKSWPKLLAPMALGQALGFSDAGKLSLTGLGVGLAFTVLDLALIVLLNDWGDRAVDAIKRRRFPTSCSPKTIPDRILDAGDVLFGGLFAGVLLLVVAFRSGAAIGRPHLGLLGVGAVGLFAVYTFPPIKLNYRGGGELVEALGVGVVLPGVNAYLQSGQVASPRVLALAPALGALALSSAIASGLSDEESDREGGKRTVATMFGNRGARSAITVSLMAGVALLLASGATRPVPIFAVALAAVVIGGLGYLAMARSAAAVTRAWAAQNAFKGSLHRALWAGQLALGAALVAARVLGWR